MENIIVRVFYNCNSNAMVNGWKPGDLLQKVWDGVVRLHNGAKEPRTILSEVYSYLNGEFHSMHRSMAVGDVVELVYDNGQVHMWACASFGWDYISDEKDFSLPMPDVKAMPLRDPQKHDFNLLEWVEAEALLEQSHNKIAVIKFLRAIGEEKGFCYTLKGTKKLVDEMWADFLHREGEDETYI